MRLFFLHATSLAAIFFAMLPFGPVQADTAEQRGLQVFEQVCSACHGMEQAHYGDMATLSPSLSTLKNWAKARQNADLNAPIASPYPSIAAGKAANGGDFPPDMSHLAATIKGGPDYIEKMLQAYTAPPAGMVMGPHNYYNPVALARHRHFRMPPPLHDGMLSYSDGTPATTANMAHDVSAFLQCANAPHRSNRAFIGGAILLYLSVMIGLLIVLKRRIRF